MIKQKTWLIAGIAIVIVLAAVLFILRSPEDSWIKDSKGICVKHGNPTSYGGCSQYGIDNNCKLNLNQSEKDEIFSLEEINLAGNMSSNIIDAGWTKAYYSASENKFWILNVPGGDGPIDPVLYGPFEGKPCAELY